MKIGIVGVGNMGRNHLRVCRKLESTVDGFTVCAREDKKFWNTYDSHDHRLVVDYYAFQEGPNMPFAGARSAATAVASRTSGGVPASSWTKAIHSGRMRARIRARGVARVVVARPSGLLSISHQFSHHLTQLWTILPRARHPALATSRYVPRSPERWRSFAAAYAQVVRTPKRREAEAGPTRPHGH